MAATSDDRPVCTEDDMSSKPCDELQSAPEADFQLTLEFSRKAKVHTKRSDISQISVGDTTCFGIRMKKDKEICMIRCIAVTSRGIVLLSDWNNKAVKVFSPDNKFLSCLTFTAEPLGISVINDQTAFVGTDDSKLHMLNISNPANISIDKSVYLNDTASTMTQYKGCLIIIKDDFKSPCVKMIDLNGKEKWSVSVDGKGNQLFHQPYSVTVSTSNGKSTAIVSDMAKGGNDTLVLIDPDNGQFIKTIDVKGKNPHGLTSDDDGNVYVCYYRTGSICVFSSDFEKSRILLPGRNLRGIPTEPVYCSYSDVLYIAYQNKDLVDRFQLA